MVKTKNFKDSKISNENFNFPMFAMEKWFWTNKRL